MVCVDRHTRGLRKRESHPCGSLNYSYGAFSSGFLWLSILICLVLSLYLVYLRILPCVHAHLSAKTDSTEGVYG